MTNGKSSPLSSRKFIAFLIAEVSWKIVVGLGLLLFKEQIDTASVAGWWFMFTVVIVAGFVEVGYIGGQAWLDRYVDVARIAANGKPEAPGASSGKTPPEETGSSSGGDPPLE